MEKKKFIKVLAVCCFFTYLCANCSDTNESGGSGTPYDASKPVTINSFYPDSGGFATRIIIEGSNFGNNPEEVRVWFNDRQAAVIGTNGDHLYAIAPRTPGDTCIISVAVGNDSASISHPFIYRTMTTVTTIAGQKGTTAFKAGTLATATFGNPQRICIDAEGNIYGAHRNGSPNWMLNEEKDIVMLLPGNSAASGQPALDITGRIVIFPYDWEDEFITYDIDMQWASRFRKLIHPTAEEVATGKQNFSISYKTAFETCQLDGMVYTYDFNVGNLVKFDAVTRKGELVRRFEGNTHGLLLFHPVEKEILYIGLVQRNAIYTYNILTDEYRHFAGTLGVAGYRDGPREDALFGDLGQMVFDDNLDLIFADAGNHCIRRISAADGMVSTVIGKPGVAGYQDGNPEDALFNYPRGMCIDKDYTIYISDTNNNCIRKLAVQ
ncbi:MAG: IPT/TIG domain-containing protein [Tannerella sp.]|jgi:hypothetical protein|nr:IPT/TIG domain-containing protein [Tannerella sp.]